MSISEDQRKFFTLSEIARSIQRALREKTDIEFWATAEVVRLNYYPHSGHCYPQLVEKSGNKVLAEMRSTLWKMDYFRINNTFKKTLGEGLKDGITIYFKTRVNYDPKYGLSLHIIDIDPVYSLGVMEQQRLQTIQRLTKENLFTKNKQLPEPFLIKSLAVISVSTSKGYSDFINVLQNYHKSSGYLLDYTLYPALLQGDQSPSSIIKQLEAIRENKHIEAVAIIRGGGGDVGLASYNDYELSRHIAEYPLPIYAGIGHATNETVAELVSYRYFISPTDLAKYFMSKFQQAQEIVSEAKKSVKQTVLQNLNTRNEKLHSIKKNLTAWSRQVLRTEKGKLEAQKNVLHESAQELIQHAQEDVEALRQLLQALPEKSFVEHTIELSQLRQQMMLYAERSVTKATEQLARHQKTVEILSPDRLMERGFSLTTQDGKVLKSVQEMDPSKTIETQLVDGKIQSKPL